MFDFGYSELLIVAVVLLVVVGPKELPGLLRVIFDFVSKIKIYAAELRTGVQSIANDIEIFYSEAIYLLKKLQDYNKNI